MLLGGAAFAFACFCFCCFSLGFCFFCSRFCFDEQYLGVGGCVCGCGGDGDGRGGDVWWQWGGTAPSLHVNIPDRSRVSGLGFQGLGF